MKNLILGLGNSVFSNEGVGLRIADNLKTRFRTVDVISTTLEGIKKPDMLEEYDQLFLISPISSENGTFGEVKMLQADIAASYNSSSFGKKFFKQMADWKHQGYQLPEVVTIYGVEIGDRDSDQKAISNNLDKRLRKITTKIYHHIFLRISRVANPSVKVNTQAA